MEEKEQRVPGSDENNEKASKPKVKLPSLKVPKISLPKLPKISIDFRLVWLAVLVAGIALLNTVLVVRFAGPQIVLKDPRMTRFADEGEHIDESQRKSDSGKLPRYVLSPSMVTHSNLTLDLPEVEPSAYIHRQAFVAGAVNIGKACYVGPQVSIRGDIGQGVRIGDESNIQDGAVIAGLPSESSGEVIKGAVHLIEGKPYSVYLGSHVTLAPQSQVHGPATVGDGTYLGMQTLVFHSIIGKNCVLEPRSAAIGVVIPNDRYIEAGRLVSRQDEADTLPRITGVYPYVDFGAKAVKTHVELAEALHGR